MNSSDPSRSKAGKMALLAASLLIFFAMPVAHLFASSVPSVPRYCPSVDFISSFMRRGIDNDPSEVKKLQYFLNRYEGANLPLDGVFDTAVENSVKSFQAKYASEVLSPWGIVAPSGIVYITTAGAINRIFCSDNPSYKGAIDFKDAQVAQVPSVRAQATSAVLALSSDTRDLVESVPPSLLLIAVSLLMGLGLIIRALFQKDIDPEAPSMSPTQGFVILSVGSVLDVLNALSYRTTGFSPGGSLSLVVLNLAAVVVLSTGMFAAFHVRAVKVPAK